MAVGAEGDGEEFVFDAHLTGFQDDFWIDSCHLSASVAGHVEEEVPEVFEDLVGFESYGGAGFGDVVGLLVHSLFLHGCVLFSV